MNARLIAMTCLFCSLQAMACVPADARDATGAATPPDSACSAPAYRQFDFFIGDWDTYDVSAPGKVVARNTVDMILGGCVIREDYRRNNGLHGRSFSLYDAATGKWHQSWVTDRGELLLLDGGLHNGRMEFTGKQATQSGKPSVVHVVWYRQGRNVRETSVRSSDGGKTWRPMFDIVFKPHRQ